MTDRELFQTSIRHEPADRFLYYFGSTPPLERKVRDQLGIPSATSLREHFGCFAPVDVPIDLAPEGDPGLSYDFNAHYEDVKRPEGSFLDENGVLHVPGSMYHFDRMISPLRRADSLEEIDAYPVNAVVERDYGELRARVEEIHASGRVAFARCRHLYEEAWQIRGYENFLADMMLEPERCHSILERLLRRNIRIAEIAAEAGVDYLRSGDDVAIQTGMMYDPAVWWDFIGYRWQEVYRAAERANPETRMWYHSDGDISAIVDRLPDMGVDILNPVQPECMEAGEIFARVGSRVVLDGGVGTQTTMPFGSAAEVRERVRELKRLAKEAPGRALILSPTHVLEPEVPVENIVAFVEESGRPM
jgi:uroporphyrinogen decarboxylase